MGYQSFQIWMASQHICTIASEVALLFFRWKSNNRDFALKGNQNKTKTDKNLNQFLKYYKKAYYEKT